MIRKYKVSYFSDIDVEGAKHHAGPRKMSLQPQSNLIRLVLVDMKDNIMPVIPMESIFRPFGLSIEWFTKTNLSAEYKRRQSRKFTRSDPLHAQWHQTDQMRRISQTSTNENETRTSFSRSLENNRIKSITRTPRNTRTSRNDQNGTILEEQLNMIAEKLTEKINEENDHLN